MIQLKACDRRYVVSLTGPTSYNPNWTFSIDAQQKYSDLHVDIDVSPKALETFIADCITQFGLTRKIQKALKPLLVDAAHAQGIHS